MNYAQFVAEFLAELQQNMAQENTEFIRQTIRKINEVLDGILIKYPDSPVAPTIYLEDKYQMYQEGYSVEQIAKKTSEQLKNMRQDTLDVLTLTEESARQNLYCVVINAAENEEMLRDVPYERVEDLAVIPRFRVGEDMSFVVSKNICNHLHMTSEEILEIAHVNTNKQKFECRNMTEIMREIMQEQGLSDEYISKVLHRPGDHCPMYVVSNESCIDGAVALTSESTMISAFERIKEDYPNMENMYILGSSRHELILIPDNVVDSVENLKSIHLEVQRVELSKRDKLSNNIYKFDARSKQISIADAPVLTESKFMEIKEGKLRGRSR